MTKWKILLETRFVLQNYMGLNFIGSTTHTQERGVRKCLEGDSYNISKFLTDLLIQQWGIPTDKRDGKKRENILNEFGYDLMILSHSRVIRDARF